MPAKWIVACLVGALGALAGACSTEPYRVVGASDPPWNPTASRTLPAVDPPFSERAHWIAICYGSSVNEEEEVLAWAEEICGSGRLVLVGQTSFWNGCSLLQPARVSYICDPPPESAEQP